LIKKLVQSINIKKEVKVLFIKTIGAFVEKDVVWANVKEKLKDICKPVFYKKFISSLQFKSFNGQSLVLSAPNKQIKLHIESRYINDISRICAELQGCSINVKIVTSQDRLAKVEVPKHNAQELNPIFEQPQIRPGFSVLDNSNTNPKYNFEDFVRGSCNELSYQACKRVQDAPGNAYNPLYIYGQPGMGKTHLLHATANAIKIHRPWLRIVYLTMDDYTTLWIQSIRNKTHETFKAKIRSVDLLLIDDIHSLNKNATNTAEELFNTFNHLHSLNKQIIFTSDRTPAELNVEDRLKTRFGWGLIAEITPPDYETRKIIFQKKAEKLKLELPEEVLNYLAENLDTNIRFLESAINKLHATSSLLHTPIDLSMTIKITKGIIKVSPKSDLYTFNRILKAVAKITDINEFDILGKSRIKSIAEARHLGMFLSAKFCKMSKKEIAVKFGRSDHTTVINAEKNINKKLQNSPEMQIVYDEIIHQLKLG